MHIHGPKPVLWRFGAEYVFITLGVLTLGELIFNGLLLIFFTAMLISSSNIRILQDDLASRYWPMTLLGAAVLIFAIKVWRIWRNLPKEEGRFHLVETFNLKEPGVQKLLAAITLLVTYVALLPYGGFILATTLFTVGMSYILGTKSIIKSLLTGIGVIIPIYVIFGWGLGVRLPRGVGALFHISLWLESLMW